MNDQLEAFLSEIRQIPDIKAAARTDACWHQCVTEIKTTFCAIRSASELCPPLREVLDTLLSTIADKGSGVEQRLVFVGQLFKQVASFRRTLH